MMKLFGKNPVLERLRSNPQSIHKIFIQPGLPEAAYIYKKAKQHGIPVFAVHGARWYAREPAAAQGAFWPFVDALYADQGRIDDPHLWDKAGALGLDVERFDADRRGEPAVARVARDVRDGLRAGVAQTPTLIIGGALHGGVPTAEWLGSLH